MKKLPRKRNPVARELRSPKYRTRIVEVRQKEPDRREDIKSRMREWREGRSDWDGPFSILA